MVGGHYFLISIKNTKENIDTSLIKEVVCLLPAWSAGVRALHVDEIHARRGFADGGDIIGGPAAD